MFFTRSSPQKLHKTKVFNLKKEEIAVVIVNIRSNLKIKSYNVETNKCEQVGVNEQLFMLCAMPKVHRVMAYLNLYF